MGIANGLHGGFTKMRDAISNGRNLVQAFIELSAVAKANPEEAPFLMAGAVFCLLDSVSAIEEAGLLAEAPPGPWGDFIKSGHQERVNSLQDAMQTGDLARIGALASVMSNCIAANQHRLKFTGTIVGVTQ